MSAVARKPNTIALEARGGRAGCRDRSRSVAVRGASLGNRVSSSAPKVETGTLNEWFAAAKNKTAAAASVAVLLSSVAVAGVASADIRLPPLDRDPNRCERAFVGNTIGQSNAVSDRVLDLRYCDLPSSNLKGIVLSGALMSDANLKGGNLTEAVMTKAYAVGANFDGADFTSAVIDRVDMKKASFKGANFYNAVITGTEFEGADLTEANFEDALIGSEDVKRLCLNPTLAGASRFQVGCRGK